MDNAIACLDLSYSEQRRLRLLTRDVPQRDELPDLDPPPEQMATTVLDVLDGVIHFVDAFEESIALTDGEE